MLAKRGLSHTIASPVLELSQFENPQAQIFERRSGVTRCQGHERVVGHPRRGVDLEKTGLPLAVEHEVHAAPSAAAQDSEGSQRLVLNDALGARGQSAGNDVAGILGAVLRLVVVKLAWRFELDQRKGGISQDPTVSST